MSDHHNHAGVSVDASIETGFASSAATLTDRSDRTQCRNVPLPMQSNKTPALLLQAQARICCSGSSMGAVQAAAAVPERRPGQCTN
jgi:hypothetical protein